MCIYIHIAEEEESSEGEYRETLCPIPWHTQLEPRVGVVPCFYERVFFFSPFCCCWPTFAQQWRLASIKRASVLCTPTFGRSLVSLRFSTSSHWPFFPFLFVLEHVCFPSLLDISIKDPTLPKEREREREKKKSVRSPSLCMRGVWKSSHWLPRLLPHRFLLSTQMSLLSFSLFIPPKRLFHDIRAASVEASSSCPRHDDTKGAAMVKGRHVTLVDRDQQQQQQLVTESHLMAAIRYILTAAVAPCCFLRDVSLWLSFIHP